MKRLKSWWWLGLLSLPQLVFAQAPQGGNITNVLPPKGTLSLPGNAQDRLGSVVTGYINVFLGVVGLVAVGFLIYGGFQYVTSGGNEEQAESGKKTIQNSLIGLVIIILSYTIIVVVTNALFGYT